MHPNNSGFHEKGSLPHLHSLIDIGQIISSTVFSHTQLSYGILCHMQHSWHPLWTNLSHWSKAITTKQQTSV